MTDIQNEHLNNRRYRVWNATSTTFQLLELEYTSIEGVTAANPPVISAIGHPFSDDDVIHIEKVEGMTDLNGKVYRIENAADDTFELKDVLASGYSAWLAGGQMRLRVENTGMLPYRKGGTVRIAKKTISGLHHLEGKKVVVMANGNVLPTTGLDDATSTTFATVVVDGQIKLKTAASRVHIGLYYISDLETLNIEATDKPLQGEKTKISKVMVRFEKSRLPMVGHSAGDLIQMKQRTTEPPGRPTDMITGDIKVGLKPEWNSNGRIYMRQVQPGPMTVLLIQPDADLADG